MPKSLQRTQSSAREKILWLRHKFFLLVNLTGSTLTSLLVVFYHIIPLGRERGIIWKKTTTNVNTNVRIVRATYSMSNSVLKVYMNPFPSVENIWLFFKQLTFIVILFWKVKIIHMVYLWHLLSRWFTADFFSCAAMKLSLVIDPSLSGSLDQQLQRLKSNSLRRKLETGWSQTLVCPFAFKYLPIQLLFIWVVSPQCLTRRPL